MIPAAAYSGYGNEIRDLHENRETRATGESSLAVVLRQYTQIAVGLAERADIVACEHLDAARVPFE